MKQQKAEKTVAKMDSACSIKNVFAFTLHENVLAKGVYHQCSILAPLLSVLA